jgi:hypothetical protein
VFRSFLTVVPRSIAFRGTLKKSETHEKRDSILAALGELLEKSDLSRRVLEILRNEYVLGNSSEDSLVSVDLESTQFQFARLSMGYSQGELFYKFVFSQDKVPYPLP